MFSMHVWVFCHSFYHWEDSVAIRNRNGGEGSKFMKEVNKLEAFGDKNASRSDRWRCSSDCWKLKASDFSLRSSSTQAGKLWQPMWDSGAHNWNLHIQAFRSSQDMGWLLACSPSQPTLHPCTPTPSTIHEQVTKEYQTLEIANMNKKEQTQTMTPEELEIIQWTKITLISILQEIQNEVGSMKWEHASIIKEQLAVHKEVFEIKTISVIVRKCQKKIWR